MKRSIERVKKLLRNTRSMAIFLIVYHVFFTLILYLLYTFCLRAILRVRGYSYLTLGNLLPTLAHPLSLLFLFLLFSTAAFLICIEAGILIVGFEASLAERTLSIRQLVVCGLSRLVRRMRHQHLYFTLPLAAYHLVSCAFLLYRLGFRVNPYSTFIPIILTKPAYYVPFIVICVFLFVFAFLRVFAFFFWYISGYSFKESRKKGLRLFLAHPFILLREFFLANALVAGIWAVLRYLTQFLLVLLVHLFVPARLEVALALSLNTPLSLILLWLCAVVAIFVNYAMLVRVYCRYSGENPILSFHLYRPHLSALKQRLFITAGILVSLVLVVVAVIGFYNGALAAERLISPVRIYCHRGFSSKAPENTLPAITEALDALADGVEVDVQMTKDGVIVLSHDVNTKRMTGVSRDITRTNYEDLLSLDFGTKFSGEYAGTQIATLAEAMELIRGRGFIIIDLKRNTASADLADRVVEMIEEYDMIYSCAVQSADTRYLKRIHELNPDITLGYILTNAIGNYYKNEMYDYFCVRSMFVNSTTVANAHREGKAIYAWTVNTRAEMERMKQAQADAIITDYPSRAKEVVYYEGDVHTVMNLLRIVLR